MKKRTDKNRYQSRYSKSHVHAAQYITELICEKKAKTQNKELPYKFWELKEWKTFYRSQIATANKLVKEFGESAVIAALHDKRAWKTYSLRSPVLRSIIEKHKEQIDLSKKIVKDVEYDFKENQKHRSSNNDKSVISKLRDLE